jgi:hypothetical protein
VFAPPVPLIPDEMTGAMSLKVVEEEGELRATGTITKTA